jgi:hypothetical protein
MARKKTSRVYAEAAFYFSGTTYTTVGYGDVALAKPLRLPGRLEGLIGIGLSTGYFFVIVNRMYQSLYVETTHNYVAEEAHQERLRH